jgi:hypothetical protein
MGSAIDRANEGLIRTCSSLQYAVLVVHGQDAARYLPWNLSPDGGSIAARHLCAFLDSGCNLDHL